MADEAVQVTQLEDRLLEVTVADNTSISAGTVLQLTDANTGSASSANGEFFAGIATVDKLANDGSTKLAVWRHGLFEMSNTDLGTISDGDKVKISGANQITTVLAADNVELSGQVVGIAMQDAAADERILVLVGS